MQSMKDLEDATELAYQEVAWTRAEITKCERDAHKLQLRIVIVTILIVPLLVGVILFAPWFTIFGPLVSLGFLGKMAVTQLHGLRNIEIPYLNKKYRRMLTQATDALQAQEDRRQLHLLNPEEYDRIEREVDAKLQERADAEEKRKLKEQEEMLWSEEFHRAVNAISPYAWL